MSKSDHGLGLAINLLQGSVDGLRSEVSTGFREIGTRLDTKADRVDVTNLEMAMDHIKNEQTRAGLDIDARFRKIEDSNLVAVTSELRVEADKRRKWTMKEKVGAFLGTIYIGGTPLLVWALTANPRH